MVKIYFDGVAAVQAAPSSDETMLLEPGDKPASCATAGMSDPERNGCLYWQSFDVNKAARAKKKGQAPRCIWFTGLSGSGKTTLACLLEQLLHAEGKHTYLLDGDNVRHGLNRDLGFCDEDRVENIRRVAEVAKLMVDAGLIVLVSFISPFERDRSLARELFADDEFIEVFIDTPIEVCERRDVKGLYVQARSGVVKNFTGIDSSYEIPRAPELVIRTVGVSPDACVSEISAYLRNQPPP